MLASLVLISSAVPIFAATTGSSAAAPASSPTYSNKMLDSGFPTWFEDINGVRVEACLDPADGNCLAPLTGPGYNSALPLDFPTNFPEEFFYSAADSEPIQVADCTVGTGTLSVHLALEAAFINGGAVQGDQMVFGRIRIVGKAGSGLCGSTWYTFRTPYGDVTVQTEPDGTILGGFAAANTIDVGCFPSPVKPCNFGESLNAPVLQYGLLTQAAGAVNGPAVPGYLGNGTFDLVEGGRAGVNSFEVLKWPEGSAPDQGGFDVPCPGCGDPLAATSNFQLLAKVAGPLEADKDIIDFGGQAVGTTSASLTSTIVNLGSGALGLDPSTTISSVEFTAGGPFALVANGCDAAVLPRSASCTLQFTYSPTALGLNETTVKVTAAGAPLDPTGVPRSVTVTLRGTGINAGDAPFGVVDQGTVTFPDTRITTLSPAIAVTVSNLAVDGATAPLLVEPLPIADPNFLISHDGCSGTYVPVDGSCEVLVRFKPISPKGIKSGLLEFNTNNATALVVALNGSALGGVATESPTNDPINTFPDWYQDERGVRVGQCDNPANLKCIAAPLPVAGDPQLFPINYPDEWFYYIMQSDAVAFTDEACLVGGELTTVAGDLSIEVAAEAAFLGPIEPNGGITFGRVRVVARDLCPDTTYIIEHPYGILTLTTNDLGAIKPNMSTVDVGCAAAPCDFHEAISAVVFEGFVTQSNRTPGYLGDPVVPGTITGAPHLDGTAEFNKVVVTKAGDAAPMGQTDQFMVSGRLVGPMVATPASVPFADLKMLSGPSTATDVVFTNQGSLDTVTLGTPAADLGGVDADQFAITGGTCFPATPGDPAVSLAPGASCTVSVAFVPTTPGDKAAVLTLHHSGKNDPLEVQLSGLGLSLDGTAAISPSLRTVQFTDRHVGDSSEVVHLVLSNAGGDEVLVIDPLGASFPVHVGDFAILGTTCDVAVPIGSSCRIDLQYTPSTAGATTQTLTLTSNAVAPTNSLDITLKGRGSSVNTVAAQAVNDGGFPLWYQDRNGVRMEACLVNDGNCVLLADPTFNPGAAVSFPNNFPLESFYTLADSDIVTIPAHSCGVGLTATGGTAQLRIGTEAAFTTTTPANGGQTVFNRIRVIATGLCPNTTYHFTHPYGTYDVTTDENGEIRAKAGTFDNDAVLASFPVTSFLRWDPNVGPTAPAGYVGSYATLHRLVGGTYRPDGVDVVNYFAVQPTLGVGLYGPEVGRTDLFNLAGRIAGPLVIDPKADNFGTWEVGVFGALEAPVTRQFSVLNLDVTDVHVTGITLTGANPAEFEIVPAATTCTGATIVRDSSCLVTVRFKGSAVTGARSATLEVTTDASRPKVSAALTATVIPAQSPSLTVTPASFSLGSLQVGVPSAIQTITVKNSGTGWLTLTDADAFIPVTNATVTLQPAVVGGKQKCAVGVELAPFTDGDAAICEIRFTVTPTAKGAVSATYKANGVDTTSAHVGSHVAVAVAGKTVGLTATGVQATISISATSVSISARAGETKNVKVTLTNTGTANFSLQGNPAIEVVNVAPATASRYFLNAATVAGGVGTNPSSTCTAAIAPGKTCQLTINFTGSTAQAIGSTYQVRVWLYGNASNLGSKASGTGMSVLATGTRAR